MYNVTLRHCCSGKALSITYSDHVFVALVIQLAMYVHHTVCGLADCTAFFNIIP